MTAVFCPQCGSETSGEFKFCPSCGAKLPTVSEKTESGEEQKDSQDREDKVEILRCPTCGFINDVGTKACESCGSFLGGVRGEKIARTAPISEPEERQVTAESAQNRPTAQKRNKKGQKQHHEKNQTVGKRFHLEAYQITAIAAALVLGAVLIYGLLSSGPTPSASVGSSAPSQQTTSSGQPNANILHEINRLREVVNKEPDNLQALLSLSNILQDNGFYDQAAVYYKRYLTKMPKNVDARVDYGVTLFEGGNTPEAIDQIKNALKIDPDHQIGLFNLGIIYLNAGDIQEANAAFKKCVKVDPNSDIAKKAKQAIDEHTNITSQEVN